ncbi:hypothetical protein M0L20_22555 [Spirosoma sp. RP8]|uniref:Uncharacterized protein n=1 Tax=Spirosoma liriopis TaxID=2937440 RepID=A0ABT0HRB0_9BACT|nr:hypothetical protein [Spirosoma liriopis]MCK8494667.1 hypothetical protein [Spirosoma liriopis]
MNEQPSGRQWKTLEIAVDQFRQRMERIAGSSSGNGSVYSRLALIHQAAKAYAVETAPASITVEIEEITNPPLYEEDLSDDPVVIQFSYW